MLQNYLFSGQTAGPFDNPPLDTPNEPFFPFFCNPGKIGSQLPCIAKYLSLLLYRKPDLDSVPVFGWGGRVPGRC
ncbi:hypothetical protein [Siphonobacter aquaeclarae]|uniref:hypothetical protein n=1 Tax=Siphonobacter aquaeclarae TaxID=563176 RepID=UPI001C408D51|nr:hypothetical protein [Siphonobacter aquaeclarae]